MVGSSVLSSFDIASPRCRGARVSRGEEQGKVELVCPRGGSVADLLLLAALDE